MKISVIIPAHNEAKFIGRALQSLVEQKLPPHEVIVVDNNCKDKTAALVRGFGFRLIKERVQGMIPARNRGFNEARGDILARIDADVEVPNNWTKKIKKNFEIKNIDGLTGPVIFSDAGLMANSTLPSHLYLESLRLFTRGNRYLQGPNMVITKKIWRKVKNAVSLNDAKVHEDLDLSLKIIGAGGKIGYDRSFIVWESARRLKSHPESFFIEYPLRVVSTFVENKK